MEWLSQNWIFLLVAVAFVAMHLFSHGGHGGHLSPRRDEGDEPGGHRH